MDGKIYPKKIIRYLWIALSLFTLIAVGVDGVDVAKSVSILMFLLAMPASMLGALLMGLLQDAGLLPVR